MASTSPSRESRMQPPMTPMIDCVFQLLIFFMLTPNFQAGEAFLTTNLPQTGARAAAADEIRDFLRIRLEEAGPRGEGVAITLAESQALGANFDALAAALADLRGRGLAADYPVLIQPSSGTRHQWVVRAFDGAVAARFTNIRFAVP